MASDTPQLVVEWPQYHVVEFAVPSQGMTRVTLTGLLRIVGVAFNHHLLSLCDKANTHTLLTHVQAFSAAPILFGAKDLSSSLRFLAVLPKPPEHAHDLPNSAEGCQGLELGSPASYFLNGHRAERAQ